MIESIAAIITRTVEDALRLIGKEQVAMKQLTTRKALLDAIDSIKGAVMIAYPMGLPPYDTVRQILDEKEDLAGSAAGLEVVDPENAATWWANKELQAGKLLSDFVGKNEKTKIVCKLQKKGSGAPQREPVISREEQQAMIAHYHQKQQEAKVLEANTEDDYANSAWANPKSLKNAFTGIGDVSWRPR
uniref:Cilia- and flagella-associated protein 298 n=1 Tax=Diacronema lutheri TaxID=2081491 RepID=A0A7R9YN80_DIALT